MSLNSSITSQGTVKFNAQRDVVETHRRKRYKKTNLNKQSAAGTFAPFAQASRQDDVFTIMPRELCLRWMTPTTHKHMHGDSDVNVFSSANCLFLDKATAGSELSQAKDDAAKVQVLRRQLEFGGVAVTRAVFSTDQRTDDQMVVLFGGSTTIRNTGHAPIRSGDYVQWDLPLQLTSDGTVSIYESPRSKDAPKEKLLFQTKPFRESDCDVTAEDIRTLENAAYNKDSLNGVLRNRFYHNRRRVFGRALSSAEKGKEFDILLGRYMA